MARMLSPGRDASLGRWLRTRTLGGLGDAQLVERFASSHEEEVFAVLLSRHGALVHSVCRRILGNEADAEDAFQTTFLLLSRKAGSIRKPAALASWLHGVAARQAHKAKVQAARRRRREHAVRTPPRSEPGFELAWRELQAVLDRELARLPANYRTPLVLCYLEGKTHEEAARELGWPVGTVSSRLARGRELLKDRLTRRGLALAAGPFAVLLASSAAEASLPSTLRRITLELVVREMNARTPSVLGSLLAGSAALLTGKLGWGVGLFAFLGLTMLGAALHEAPPPAGPAAFAGANPPTVAPPAPPRTDRYGDPLPPSALLRLGTVRFRHGQFLWHMAFAPDGKTIVAKDADHNIIQWDAATGQEVRRFTCPNGNFACGQAVFSPDGRFLASGDGQKVLHIWDVATGNEVQRLPDRGWVTWLEFSPDGRLLALSAYGEDTTVSICDPFSGETLHRLKGHTKRVECVRFSPDGKFLATASLDHTVRLWDAATGQPVRTLPGHAAGATTLAFAPDGQTLASGGYDNMIRFWKVATGKQEGRLEGHKSSIFSIAFSSDGGRLVSGDDANRMLLWETATGRQLREINKSLIKYSSVCAVVAFSPDGKKLVGRGPESDRCLCLWDPDTGKELVPRDGHLAPVAALAVSTDGRAIASLDRADARRIHLWDGTSGRLRNHLTIKGADWWALWGTAFSPDGRTLAAFGRGGPKLFRWDTASGRELPSLTADYIDHTCNVAFAPDGHGMATADTSGLIHFWDVAKGKVLPKIAGNQVELVSHYKIVYSPDGRLLASGEIRSGTVHIWDVATGRRRRTLRPPARSDGVHYNLGEVSLTFSPDGRGLAVAGGGLDATVRLWEIATGRERFKLGGEKDPLTSAAFSPDGHTLMVRRSNSDTLRFLDAATGHEVGQLKGHRGPITAAVLLADNRRVVTGSEDTTILVWDAGAILQRKRPVQVLQAKDIEASWADLCGGDAAKAYRAIGILARSPQSVGFLKQRLRPMAAGDEKQIARWIADLDSRQFAVRQQARAELEKAGEHAETALRRVLDGKPSLELRRQAEPLLDKIIDQYPAPDQLGPCRAVEVLEQIGSAEACQVLETLAKGAAQGRLTREARASLHRLARRPVDAP